MTYPPQQPPAGAPDSGDPQQPQSPPPPPQQPQPQPQPGEPYSGWSYAAPTSGAPASPAPSYGAATPPLHETQQFPVPPPYAQPQPPQDGAPAAKRRPWVLILAITTGLFFVLSGVMTGLYLSTSNDLDAVNGDIRDLKRSLQSSQEALRRNKAALKDSEEANRAHEKCVTEVTEVFDSLDRTGRASARIVTEAENACDKAERYID